TTVMSSISVNPESSRAAPALPVTVLRPVEGRALALGEDVVDVGPAPGRAVGLVLVAPHPPLVALGQGIQGDAAQALQLAVERAHAAHALHERLEVGRIAFAAELDVRAPDRPLVDRLLVAVDRGADLTQAAAQLELALALVADAGHRHDRRGQDHDDRGG